MEAPSWMFTKALSHKQKVLRLFKKSMREVDHFYQIPGLDMLEWRYQRVMMRARFDHYAGEKDLRKSKQLLVDGCREIWEKRFPKPNAFQFDPRGVAYQRNTPPTDDFLDENLTYPEREEFPYYMNRRERRKQELLSEWEGIDESWDREIGAIQRKLPEEKPKPMIQ